MPMAANPYPSSYVNLGFATYPNQPYGQLPYGGPNPYLLPQSQPPPRLGSNPYMMGGGNPYMMGGSNPYAMNPPRR